MTPAELPDYDKSMTTQAQDFTAANTDYVLADAGTVTLGTTTFRIETQTYLNGTVTTWLYGSRGAVFFLRGYLGADTGHRQVISWKSGRELRQRGNEITVTMLGDVIEQTR